MNANYSVEVLEPHQALENPALIDEWEQLLQSRERTNAIFASPAWLSHLAAMGHRTIAVWCIRDRAGALTGIVSAHIVEQSVDFAVSNRVLLRRRLTCARLLGSDPVLPDVPELYEQVINSVFQKWPNCAGIHLEALPTDCGLWRNLNSNRASFSEWFAHVMDGPRPWHLLKLSASFEGYLKSMSPKARETLRRQSRRLGKINRGDVNIERVTMPSQVAAFLDKATQVSRRSWQHRVLGQRISTDEASVCSYTDLAERGLLRGYILDVGQTPCAFVVGYQKFGVFHYAELGFDEEFREYSPGTVLLYSIVEDLHIFNPPQILNFGIGDASYKRRFGNLERSDIACLLLRKSISNRLLASSHSLFNKVLISAKRAIGRRVEK